MTGRRHTTPLVHTGDADRLVIVASKEGAPENPAWCHNLRANPRATVEVGDEQFEVLARITEGDERRRLFDRQAEATPQFGE